jgi:hypothetical protein
MKRANLTGAFILSFALGLAFGLGAGLEIKPADIVYKEVPATELQHVAHPSPIGESIERAKLFEGFAKEVYEFRGDCHIGYGHITDCNNPSVVTQEQAEYRLYQDMLIVETALEERLAFYDELHPNAKLVLLDMGLNMGVTGLFKFDRMLYAMDNGLWWDVIMEIEDSLYFEQVNSRALDNTDMIYIIYQETQYEAEAYMF